MLLNHGYVYPLDEIGRRNLDVDKLSVANSYNFVEHVYMHILSFRAVSTHCTIYIRCEEHAAICINLISDSRPINLARTVLDTRRTCHLESKRRRSHVSRWAEESRQRNATRAVNYDDANNFPEKSFFVPQGEWSRIAHPARLDESDLRRFSFHHVHPPVYVKGYNQFFEELDFPSFAMGSREINRVEGFAENIWTGN